MSFLLENMSDDYLELIIDVYGKPGNRGLHRSLRSQRVADKARAILLARKLSGEPYPQLIIVPKAPGSARRARHPGPTAHLPA